MEISDQSQENVPQNAPVEANSENEIVERTMDWFCFENDIKAVKKFEPLDIEGNANVTSLDQINFDEIEIKQDDNEDGDGKLVCFVCNQKFDQYELELHFLECSQDSNSNQVTSDEDQVKETYKCKICFKEFQVHSEYIQHTKIQGV